MTEGRPPLAAVPSAEPASEPSASELPARGRGWAALPWVLGAALALAALGWTLEAQQSRQLAESLQAAQGALAEARARIEATDAHLGQVRDRVTGLAGQLRALEELLARGPAVPGAGGAAAGAPAGETPAGEAGGDEPL